MKRWLGVASSKKRTRQYLMKEWVRSQCSSESNFYKKEEEQKLANKFAQSVYQH